MMTNDFSVETVTVLQLRDLLLSVNPPIVLDVREKHEVAVCALPTFVHIPLGDLVREWHQLPKGATIVTLCHHGYRSLKAALFLKSLGFECVANIQGGIQAWAEQIDLDMPQY